ncbi:MAG: transposase [Acidobacteriota bacterium]|nr:transposase [Acidobacteriota bacterium]
MPYRLQRYQQTGNFHFITFSCYRRAPLLAGSSAKDTVLNLLEQTRSEHGLCIAAYVLMPEHVHLLTDEPSDGTLAAFLQVFKQRCSRALKSEASTQFWQRRYYDFNVNTAEKRIEKLRYIHRNPVRRGLVAEPQDYRWSSFCHYATGEVGVVEVESEWTAVRRERLRAGVEA